MVTFNIEYEVDVGSEEAQEIYKEAAQALLDEAFIGESSPLGLEVSNDGLVSIAFNDFSCGVYGAITFEKAVSSMLVFDDSNMRNEEDKQGAIDEATAAADAFEAQAKRLRDKIASL